MAKAHHTASVAHHVSSHRPHAVYHVRHGHVGNKVSTVRRKHVNVDRVTKHHTYLKDHPHRVHMHHDHITKKQRMIMHGIAMKRRQKMLHLRPHRHSQNRKRFRLNHIKKRYITRYMSKKQAAEIRQWRKIHFNLHSQTPHGGKRVKMVPRPDERDVLAPARTAEYMRRVLKRDHVKANHIRKVGHTHREHSVKVNQARRHILNKKRAMKERISHERAFSQPDNSLQQLMNSERQSGLPLIDINQVNPSLAQQNVQVNNLPQFGE